MKRARLGLLLAVIALGAVLPSCGDRPQTGPDADAGGLGTAPEGVAAQATKLVECESISSIPTVRKIGRRGGSIDVGPYTLTIPAGALDRDVMIDASIPRKASINVVQFKPDGLTFRIPATLTMTYANCDPKSLDAPVWVDSEASPPLRIAVVDDAFTVLYYLPSTQLAAGRTVVGELKHFTNYAVAW